MTFSGILQAMVVTVSALSFYPGGRCVCSSSDVSKYCTMLSTLLVYSFVVLVLESITRIVLVTWDSKTNSFLPALVSTVWLQCLNGDMICMSLDRTPFLGNAYLRYLLSFLMIARDRSNIPPARYSH
jgi:hypothetical protein